MADRNPNTKYQIPSTPQLLVVVGPTASGKSDLAMRIAKILDGEIICADSRTVYKGLDIGTAKPSGNDRKEVTHHLLDVVDPDEPFTAADFKAMAEQAIDDIQGRSKLPIMVGGSGLYIDALLFNYAFSDADAPRDETNPRHLSKNVSRVKSKMRGDAVVIGLNVPREMLKKRITDRIDGMLAEGLLEEVKFVQENYPHSKALLAPGYKAFGQYLAGHITLAEAKALFIKNDYNLAKRQMTWFRRNKNIHWLNNPNTYVEDVRKLLNKLH